jgi:hypothetical protein
MILWCQLQKMQLQYTAIPLEQAIVKTVKTYSTRVEADLTRIALDAAGVPSVIVGIEAAFERGTGGVQLLVPRRVRRSRAKGLERS